MHPILVDFGTWTLPLLGKTHLFLPTYGLVFAVGAFTAWWWFVRRAASLGLPAEPVFNLGLYALLAGLLGAKVTLVLVDFGYYSEHPREILDVVRSAGVLMGGVLAALVTFIAYARARGLPVFALGDAVVAPLALAQGIGRIGCFLAGCCWGVPTSGFCAVRFTDPAAHEQTGVPLGEPLVPIQLIQAAADVALAAYLAWLWRRRVRPEGTTCWLYFVLYGVSRGTLEFFRGDSVRGMWFGGALSTSQIFSIASIAVGSIMLLRIRRRSYSTTA